MLWRGPWHFRMPELCSGPYTSDRLCTGSDCIAPPLLRICSTPQGYALGPMRICRSSPPHATQIVTCCMGSPSAYPYRTKVRTTPGVNHLLFMNGSGKTEGCGFGHARWAATVGLVLSVTACRAARKHHTGHQTTDQCGRLVFIINTDR
ncbi:hypothetical protein FQN60_013196, partial [Etheostoma spectabile]